MDGFPLYWARPVPKGLEGLVELALDLRWSWNHTADEFWHRIAPEMWEKTGNPWLILQNTSAKRLEALLADAASRKLLDEYVEEHREHLRGSTWFQRTFEQVKLSVAYFSMEFGLSEALPIYSGGLGILAGDYLKAASDLGVPSVGVGLLYQQGYFRQAIDSSGRQLEFFPYNDPSQLPVAPILDADGEWLKVEVEFPGRILLLRAWEATVGRTKLYLLDSNDPINDPADRGITSELYGGGSEQRLRQEIVLGIGGWALLEKMGRQIDVCHLNEGHAAFAVLERARSFMQETGHPFGVALTATRAGNIFTTHTPVEAGFDRFEAELIRRYFGSYLKRLGIDLDALLSLGRVNPGDVHEPFNMAFLAVRGCCFVNGVSRLHSEVSRRIFQPLFYRIPRQEVPVTSVTNGVHTPSWDSAAADDLWSNACGKGRWLDTMDTLEEDMKGIPDAVIWEFRRSSREHLVEHARERMSWQLASVGSSIEEIALAKNLLDPDALTIGFARRFTDYKRPTLLLHDPDRLARILANPERSVQLIVAGKAHPNDSEGKSMIKAWADFVRRDDIRHHAVFMDDYDMALAQHLVEGVDLWVNTPRRPWEACGTSGMKTLVNGGLNLSELDGWWAEAYQREFGWALGDGKEHEDDPALDATEADQLYRLLEDEVIPCFYDRDSNGIPTAWVARVRASMAELSPRFSANRMLREYVERLYMLSASEYGARTADRARRGVLVYRWHDLLQRHWKELRFGTLEAREEDGEYLFRVPVSLGMIEPHQVRVQLYAESVGTDGPEVIAMEPEASQSVSSGELVYVAHVRPARPMRDYTPRIIPFFEGVQIPIEAPYILWLDS
jgi:starch phosphorylase